MAWQPPWGRILRWIRQEVQRHARSHRLSAWDVEEVCQRGAVRLVTSLGRYDPAYGPAGLRAWVKREVGWALADLFRERDREPLRLGRDDGDRLPDGGDPGVDAPASDGEFRAALARCVGELSAVRRRRFLRWAATREDRVPQTVLAEEEGVSRDAYRESLGAALRSLRRCLLRRGFGPPPDSPPPPRRQDADSERGDPE